LDEFSTLIHISEKIELLKPENLLKKGYSLSYINGRIVSDIDNIKEGDILTTKLNKGEIESKIIKTKKR
jgi:exodeoxyribonuclease VII large subunit